MPINHTDTLNTKIDELERRLRALEQSNAFEHASIFNGALNIFDLNGNLVLSLGLQPDQTYGLALYDPATGNKLINLGQLGSGTFGLATRNAAGILQAVSGGTSAFVVTAVTTSSLTPVIFPDDPKVTVVIGPSGQAQVTFGAAIVMSGLNDAGYLTCTVDGVIGGNVVTVNCNGSVAVSASVSQTIVLTGLTPGSHVFSVAYYCGTGVYGCTFADRFVTVNPY